MTSKSFSGWPYTTWSRRELPTHRELAFVGPSPRTFQTPCGEITPVLPEASKRRDRISVSNIAEALESE